MQRHEEVTAYPAVVSCCEDSLVPRLSGEQADAPANGILNRMDGGAKRKKLRAFTNKTKAKTKKFLKFEDGELTSEGSVNEDHGILQNLERDPAFNQNEFSKQKRWHDGGTSHRSMGTLGSIATTVAHPVKAIKSKATRTTAGQLSKVERPFISQKADLEFLEAHDKLYNVESSRSSNQATSDSEGDNVVMANRERIKEMQEHRESLRVAWTTSKHVRRVRVVPKRQMEFPDNDSFIRKDSDGKHFDWLSWLGYVGLQSP